MDQETFAGLILGLLFFSLIIFGRLVWEKVRKYRSRPHFRIASSQIGATFLTGSLLVTSIAISIWSMPYIFELWPQFGSDWSRIIITTMLMIDLVFHLVVLIFMGLLELVLRWAKGTLWNVRRKL